MACRVLDMAILFLIISFLRVFGKHFEEGDLLLGEETPVAAGQVLLGEAGEDHAVELDHLVAQELEHTAHNAVLARVDGDAHVLARIVHILHLIGNDDAVVELKAIAEGGHIDVGKVLVEFHIVGLLDLRRENRIESKLNRDQYELLLFLKPFARFYENSDFFDLFEGICLEQECGK